MAAPQDLRYLESHEWHQLKDGVIAIGISQFAVDELTDITYLDIKKKTGAIKAGESFAEIESVKATSEIYSGVDGTVVAVNKEVIDNPALINDDPYKNWLIKVQPSDPKQIEKLLSSEAYAKLHCDCHRFTTAHP